MRVCGHIAFRFLSSYLEVLLEKMRMAMRVLLFTPLTCTLKAVGSRTSMSPLLKSGGLTPKPSLSSLSIPYRTRTFSFDWIALKSGQLMPIILGKRILSLSILTLVISVHLSNSAKAEAEKLRLERYTDNKEGFTLLVPTSWIKVDKAGATVLFEEANSSFNNVGVVVIPVRVRTLGEFGSPQFVADKLLRAERNKESTLEAEVISVSERSGQEGLQVYEIEYRVLSSRGGMKRIFSAAFVASEKLYLLNISHSDKTDNPMGTHWRMILENVLHSFDAVPLVS